jgi:hypothetical protein
MKCAPGKRGDWCAINVDEKRHLVDLRSWDYCTAEKTCEYYTHEGEKCALPFSYEGTTWNSCIPIKDADQSGCPTSTGDTVTDWGYWEEKCRKEC